MVWAVSLSAMELIPHCLTPELNPTPFGVWLGLVSSRPLAHPVLYLRRSSLEAAPQCISGRTSYLRVRLAFHPYPQLIPGFCHILGFEPPLKCYLSFTLTMDSSPGFGSNRCNYVALFRLAFAAAPSLE